MAYEIYDSVVLAGLVDNTIPTQLWWANKFFTEQINSDKEEIMFDVVSHNRRLAPFVAPNVQGRVLGQQGAFAKTFRPAYVKPKGVVDINKVLKRRPGEAIMGSLSPAERWDAVVAQIVQDHTDAINRRLDWMACRAVVDGKLTIQGEDYPLCTVDFMRDPSLTVTLTGTALWNNAAGTPITNIRNMRRSIRQLGSSNITDLIFGLDAWDAFSTNPQVVATQNNQQNGYGTVLIRDSVNVDALQYMGRLPLGADTGGGGVDLWVYSDQYTDDSGNQVNYLDPSYCVGVGNVQGVQCFGAIRDKQCLQPVKQFMKMWDQEDPSETYILTQSAPLMVPAQPNASFRMKVV